MLVLAAMFWLSRLVLKLDAEGKAALRQAAFEENVRLALWRMDSTLSNFISLENARPYDSYPSLIQNPPSVPDAASAVAPVQRRLYFQFEPDGRLVLPESAEIQNAQLDQLRSKVTKSALLKSIQYTEDIQTLQKRQLPMEEDAKRTMAKSEKATAPPARELSEQDSSMIPPASSSALTLQSRFKGEEGQQELNLQELNSRNRLTTSNDVGWALLSQQSQQKISSVAEVESDREMPNDEESREEPETSQTTQPSQRGGTAPLTQTEWVKKSIQQDTNLELMHPIWLDADLFLVRRVFIDREEYVQGCWLDWPGTRRMLLELIGDLLPRADLVPQLRPPEEGQTRLLASIPVLLSPGPLPSESENGWSVLHTSLGIAWLGVLLATVAVGIVLGRTLELNQRRGAFVSAVTHELRTPLTTFRLYTEMLDEGMIADDDKRKQYMGTLRSESERLGHLVENVLAYSQLENNRGGAERIESVKLNELKERIAPRLAERAAGSGMQLIQETADTANDSSVRADLSAVERILFNLVDNAAKYAGDAENAKIEFSIGVRNGTAVLSIRDHGPGIPRQLRNKLFRPFSKSASDAANSAPGIGLGLAISRRLARQMKGDLFLDDTAAEGARFILTLPLA